VREQRHPRGQAIDHETAEIKHTMSALLAIPAGLVLGSLAAVVAHRVPRGEPFVTERASRSGRDRTMAGRGNIPLLSRPLVPGPCRHCGERISARCPLTELAMAALFAATVAILGTGHWESLTGGLALCALLVIITLTDLERRLIPNGVLLVGAMPAILLAAVTDPASVVARAIAAAVAGGSLLLIALACPRGMGMGDAKLAAVMGLYLGRAVAPALLIGFAAGALAGLALIAREGAAARKRAVPFGPFLAVGAIAGLWWGDELVDWYLSAFLGG
jgi:leader peptidase (prepilin peptidase) / N-methyltransferase